MSKSKGLIFEDLSLKMEERSLKTLERFQQATISGVTHPQLLTMLADVKSYWKDNFRPALVSYACEATGGQPSAADDVSLMISLMGAGLGIHDDIIDRSSNKHFRMTILGLHGVDNALLIGELFIVKSLTTILELIKKNYDQEKIEKIIEGFEGFFMEVWEGEFMETLCRRNLDTDLEQYLKILWMSTADTEACTRLGAILGGGSKREIEALAEFGRRLGYMFRLTDDVKDTLNLEGNLIFRLENESLPLPVLYAAKSSKERFLEIKSVLEKPTISAPEAWKVLKLCFEAEAFKYVLSLAEQNETEAFSKLDLVKNGGAKDALTLIAKNAFEHLNNFCL